MHRAAEPDEDPSQWADPNEVTEIFVYLQMSPESGQRFQAQDEDELGILLRRSQMLIQLLANRNDYVRPFSFTLPPELSAKNHQSVEHCSRSRPIDGD